jgi:iron complex transport system substrate-binding protein
MTTREKTKIFCGPVVLFLALIFFAACGSQGGSGDGSQGSAASEGETIPSEEAAPEEGSESKLPVTVTSADGEEVTVEDASRIVPLNGDVAEIVWALGLGENVVGTDVSATYPEEAQELPKFGYQRELNAEGILSLDPSVVVGTEEAGPPEVIEQIRASGVPVVILEDPPTLEAPEQKVRGVAEALGVPEKGRKLAMQTREEIDEALELAGEAESEPSVMFLYVRGQGTQMIGGRGSTADVMIRAAGGIDAGTEAGIEGYRPLTPEALSAAQPDVLLLLSAGLESVGGEEGLLQIPGIAETPAAQEDRILAYDDLYLLGMGPRTGQALRELTLDLHPELEE